MMAVNVIKTNNLSHSRLNCRVVIRNTEIGNYKIICKKTLIFENFVI